MLLHIGGGQGPFTFLGDSYMFCTKCGSPSASGDRFCQQCGCALSVVAPTDESDSALLPPGGGGIRARFSRRIWVVGAITLVLLLGGSALGLVVRSDGDGLNEDGMFGIPWGTSEAEATPRLIDRLGTVTERSSPPCDQPDVSRNHLQWSFLVDGQEIKIQAIFIEGALAAWDVDGFAWKGDRPSPIWPGMPLSEVRARGGETFLLDSDGLFQFGETRDYPFVDEVVQGLVERSSETNEEVVAFVRVLGSYRPDFLHLPCLPVM